MEDKNLWINYKNTKSIDLRNVLVEKYLYLVKRVIYSIPCTRIGIIEEDDLYSEGVIGLMDAVEKFDINKNVKFPSYACLRIKGQILDYMRKVDILTRDARKRAKNLNEFINTFQNKYGREPSLKEMAKGLNVNEDVIKRTQEEDSLSNMASFESFIEENGDIIRSKKAEEYPEYALDKSEMHKALARNIQKLKEKEKIILNLYYYEELTYKEIAQIVDLSESRISQIISGILAKLKEELQDNL